MISLTGLVASVAAKRSGMIAGMNEPTLPSAAGKSANGFFRRNWISRSEIALSSSVAPCKPAPKVSRFIQRLIEATASRARTGSPSWNFRPSRSLSTHVFLSSETV